VRADVAMVSVGAVVIAQAVTALLQVRFLGALGTVSPGLFSLEAARDADGPLSFLVVLDAILVLIAFTAVLAWLSRVVDNIPPLTRGTPLRGPRQAIGWWFVPLACWIVPYRIVADSVQRLRAADDGDLTWIRRWWWALWLASSIFTMLASRARSESIDDARNIVMLDMLSNAVWVASGVLLIYIIRRVQVWSELWAGA
jgi:hypothetical protein